MADCQKEDGGVVVTILEAQVAEAQWEGLRRAFERALEELPPQAVETFLLQDLSLPSRWQVITVWWSADSLAEYRQSAQVPGGVVAFRSVGVEPEFSVFETVGHASNSASRRSS